MITFISPGPNPESAEQVVMYNMLYGNSFELPFSHSDVRGILAYKGSVIHNEPVFYHDAEDGAVFNRALKIYMEFPKVKEDVFDRFVQETVKSSDRGIQIVMRNTYDTLKFPVEYELMLGMSGVPARRYEGFILDFKHKFSRDGWKKDESKEPAIYQTLNINYENPDQAQQRNVLERLVDVSITFISGKMVVEYV